MPDNIEYDKVITDIQQTFNENYSKDQLRELIIRYNLDKDAMNYLINYFSNEGKMFYNKEQAVKLTLNSIYGAFGNDFFYFFDIDLAETITIQGQDAILYIEDKINKYFTDIWSTDIEVHEKMEIKVMGIVKKPVVIYIDTDSSFISFEEVIKKSTWEGSAVDFIMKLYKIKLKEYIEEELRKYAQYHNTNNFLVFELESVADKAIWLAKKKYMQDIVWKDPGINYEKLSNIKSKGFENIMSSTPRFVRDNLNFMLKKIFSIEGDIRISDMIPILKDIRKKFKLEDIDKISKNLKINKYSLYINDDFHHFIIEKGCPAHVRGAGYHNFKLNNSKYKNKYRLITVGDKVRMYYAKDQTCDIFSFLPGEYPYEFAPPVDYEIQFEKMFIDPMNRVFAAIGLQTLDKNLLYAASLF